MKSKAPEQKDPKAEFRELLKASGWSQARVARELAMTPSAVSQIIRENSDVQPSRTTLRLFRVLLEKEGGSDQRTRDGWEAKVLDMLRKVPEKKRIALIKAMANVIGR